MHKFSTTKPYVMPHDADLMVEVERLVLQEIILKTAKEIAHRWIRCYIDPC